MPIFAKKFGHPGFVVPKLRKVAVPQRNVVTHDFEELVSYSIIEHQTLASCISCKAPTALNSRTNKKCIGKLIKDELH